MYQSEPPKKKESDPKPTLAEKFEDPGGDMAYNRQLIEQSHQEPEEQSTSNEASSDETPARCYYCGHDLPSDGECSYCGASNYRFDTPSF